MTWTPPSSTAEYASQGRASILLLRQQLPSATHWAHGCAYQWGRPHSGGWRLGRGQNKPQRQSQEHLQRKSQGLSYPCILLASWTPYPMGRRARAGCKSMVSREGMLDSFMCFNNNTAMTSTDKCYRRYKLR